MVSLKHDRHAKIGLWQNLTYAAYAINVITLIGLMRPTGDGAIEGEHSEQNGVPPNAAAPPCSTDERRRSGTTNTRLLKISPLTD
jgi:hypothetical protein